MHWAPWNLFDAATFGTYLGAAAALVAAPGPGQALVMARTLQGGARAGLLTSVGLNLGTVVHTVAAALGLSALLLASATAFTAVKLVGAVYLVVLGARMISGTLGPRRVATPDRPAPEPPRVASSRLLAHGVLTGVLNPKVALFFLAFLPQFVDSASAHKALAFLLLGAVFIFNGTLWCLGIAAFAAKAATRIRQSEGAIAWLNRVLGGLFVYLGIRVAMLEAR